MKKDLQEKMNGLHSGTRIEKFTEYFADGSKEEWHRHPVTSEIVILRTYTVPDGECVSFESEVVEVIPKGGYLGEIKRLSKEIAQEIFSGKAFGI